MAVNDFVGIPFNERGLTPDEGFNCWSLTVWVAQEEYGLKYPSYSEQYSTPLDYEELSNLISAESSSVWTEIPQGQEQPGDVIILRLRGIPIHAGIVVRRNKMLHVYEGIATCIEDYTRPIWKHRINGFYRLQS